MFILIIESLIVYLYLHHIVPIIFSFYLPNYMQVPTYWTFYVSGIFIVDFLYLGLFAFQQYNKQYDKTQNHIVSNFEKLFSVKHRPLTIGFKIFFEQNMTRSCDCYYVGTFQSLYKYFQCNIHDAYQSLKAFINFHCKNHYLEYNMYILNHGKK